MTLSKFDQALECDRSLCDLFFQRFADEPACLLFNPLLQPSLKNVDNYDLVQKRSIAMQQGEKRAT
jgi:hypothetical protein